MCVPLGVCQGGIVLHFCTRQLLWVRLLHPSRTTSLLLHVQQCVSACAVCVCSAHCSSPLEQFCETSLQQKLNVSG